MPARQPVPLIRAALTASLDGYIADKSGGADWLNPFFSDERDFIGFMKGIGAAVMGRRTFDLAVRGPMPPTNYPTFVLTHRPMPNPPKNYEPFFGDAREQAKHLRTKLAGNGKDIWLMGGGESIEAFRAAGEIDRLELSVIPLLLGGGIPLFPHRASGEERWKLVKHHALRNGVVDLWYEPARSGSKTTG